MDNADTHKGPSTRSGSASATGLRTEVGDAAYNSWLKQLELTNIHDDRVLMSVPTRFMRDWVVSHYAEKDPRRVVRGIRRRAADRYSRAPVGSVCPGAQKHIG